MLREYLTSIANAIRSILGGTAKINAQDFANKIQDVYDNGIEQGKLEILTQSEYMNANATGTAISVNDVSPIEHNVGCYLTSDIITDFSGIEVSRYGKNLCSDKYAEYKYDKVYGYKYLAKVPLIAHATDKDTSIDVSGCYFGFAKDPSITSSGIAWLINNGKHNGNRSNDSGYLPYLIFYPKKEETLNKVMQRWDIQVERGTYTDITPYEPYIEPTIHQANADGTVEGVTSISPNMTLLTNNSGVVINANYLRDIDTYINNLITDVALSGGE